MTGSESVEGSTITTVKSTGFMMVAAVTDTRNYWLNNSNRFCHPSDINRICETRSSAVSLRFNITSYVVVPCHACVRPSHLATYLHSHTQGGMIFQARIFEDGGAMYPGSRPVHTDRSSDIRQCSLDSRTLRCSRWSYSSGSRAPLNRP